MSRTIPSTTDTALDDPFVIPVKFVAFIFDTAPLYVHTSLGNITVLGHTWMGTGGLGDISPIEETLKDGSPGVKYRFQITNEASGSMFEEITQQDFQGRDSIIYLALRDTVTGALLDDPFEIDRFKCDLPEITWGERQSYVDLIAESEWFDGKRANGSRYSDAYLQSAYAGDTGGRYFAAMKNLKITWGGKKLVTLGGIGGSDSGPGRTEQNRPNYR